MRASQPAFYMPDPCKGYVNQAGCKVLQLNSVQYLVHLFCLNPKLPDIKLKLSSDWRGMGRWLHALLAIDVLRYDFYEYNRW